MMKKESLKILEFDKLLNAVSRYARSPATMDFITDIEPLSDKEKILERLGDVGDLRRLAQDGTPLRLNSFNDISPLIDKLRPEDSFLEPLELISFIPVFENIEAVILLIGLRNDLKHIKIISDSLTGFPELMDDLKISISPDGEIEDKASSLLFSIRTNIRSLESKITRRLDEITGDKRVSTFLQDSVVTKRSGRWVILVRMDSKGQVPGVVHDVSRSGETAFIEPIGIIGLSNELENLYADEKAEEFRIIKELCRKLRQSANEIIMQFRIIVYIDAICSIAAFSDKLKMNSPDINDDGTLKLVRARHPLLWFIKNEGVVPLDLTLGSARSVIVITGPNAGGKTISIKTAGLILLMALSGMPVPADSSSSFPVLGNVLSDIGDEQSLEESLSTFSGHISNISGILKSADSRTLVLLDELGTGTDPSQGAAIACAVLNDLKKKGSLVLATTHLIDIVAYVYKTEGMTNASMDFDRKTFKPLYRLKIGEPGESHALETAMAYGLPEDVAEFARTLQGTMQDEFHSLLRELKEKRHGFERSTLELETRLKSVLEKEKSLVDKLSALEREKTEILKKSYEEAKNIVTIARREVSDFMELEKKERKSKETLKRLEDTRKKIEAEAMKLSDEIPVALESLSVGDMVYVKSLSSDAEILHIDKTHKRLKVRSGSIEIEAALDAISLSKSKLKKKTGEIKLKEHERTAPLQINIIGSRVDEALERLEPFLNDAVLSGLNEVMIIHGVGTGRLRAGVREYLKGHPLVKSIRSGASTEGGVGVTVVELK